MPKMYKRSAQWNNFAIAEEKKLNTKVTLSAHLAFFGSYNITIFILVTKRIAQ